MILYLIPFISAGLGWLFTKLYLNSIIKKRDRVAGHIGTFSSGLINLNSITDKLKDPEQLKALSPTIEAHIEKFLRVKLQEKIPMIATFIGESTIGKLKDGMMEEINILLPDVLGKYADSLGNKLDVGSIVEKKINSLTDTEIQLALAKPLRYACMAGTLLGFIIGLVQLIITGLV